MRIKYLKKAISIGVIFSLIISLGGIGLFPSTSYGGTFTEDFSTTDYKDSANTTADWNTSLGKLRLPQPWTKADGVTSGYDNLSDNSGYSFEAQIVLDSSGRPNIVWQDATEGTPANWEIFFSRWNGYGWVKANGTPGYDNISNTTGNSLNPQIVLDTSGRPNIVWPDYTTGNGDIFFSKWTSPNWTKADGTSGYDNISNTTGNSLNPRIVLDTSGRPNIVWNDNTTGNYEIFFSKWNGSAWTKADEVNSGYDNLSDNSGESEDPRIVLDTSGRPNIVWNDNTTGNYEIFFSKWTSPNWTKADGTSGYDNLSDNSGGSEDPQIVLDTDGRPNIVWSDGTTGNGDIFFSKWTSPNWTKADGTTTPNYDNLSDNSGGSEDPQIVLDTSGRPNIVWSDGTTGNGDIFFSKWTSPNWTKADGVNSGYDNISNTTGNSLNSQIVLDTSGRPNIVWRDYTPGNYDIFFSKWTSPNWTKADGITSGYDNLSDNSGDSYSPQIVLDTSSRPNIVWYDVTTGNGDIFFSKYTGVFQSPRQAQSTKMNTGVNIIIKSTLTTSENLNGQIINYYLSANGGINWETVSIGVEHNFANQGNDLRWKAILSTTDPSITPEVDNLTIDYTLADITPPSGSISINSGATYTTTQNVTLTLSATDEDTGVAGTCFSNDGTVWSGWESFSSVKSWILSSSDGVKTVYVKYKDGASPANEGIYSDNIILDTQSPTGSILINSGASYTTTENVTLTLSATDQGTGVTGMCFSNDGSTWSGWESFSSTKSWILTDGEGNKTVYTKYKDYCGYESAVTNDSIIVDLNAPTGSVVINNGAATCLNLNVALTLSCNDGQGSGPDKMMISNNANFSGVNWEAYATSKSFTLTSGGSGTRTVYVKFRDKAGWESSVVSDTINYIADAIPPSNASIVINNGDAITHSQNVKLSLFAQDNVGVTKMMISNNANFTGATKESYATTKSWTLSSGTGEKTVYAKFFDAAGNPSAGVSDSISYVTTKSIIRLAGDDRYETAIEISKAGWPNGSAKVVLARGDMFPDALAGGTLAAKENAPILLTTSGSLHQKTSEEISRLKATGAIILGGEGAISAQVVADLKSKNGISDENIIRYGGANRYETGALIAKALNPPANKTAVIATGENYPDALASASLAAYLKMPIILIGKSSVPSGAQDALKALGINKTIIVGGEDVVDATAKSWLDTNGYPATRLAGPDRYGTAQQIAEYALQNGLKADYLTVATGENFPDALASGPFAGARKSPIVLVRKTSIPDGIKSFITTNKDTIYIVYITGGADVVSDGISSQIGSIIGAQ